MTFSPDALARIVRHHYPDLGRPPRITPISTGKFNASYRVETGTEQLVLRIAPPDDAVYVFYERRMMHQEPALHARLLAETAVPVARILAFDTTQTLIDRDYMLMERLPGRPLTEARHVEMDSVLRQVGGDLAETHALHGEGYGYVGDHRPMPPRANWVDAFQTMWQKLIDDVVSVGYYDEAERTALLELLERHLPLFDRPVPASLLHMDVWHQNILVDEPMVNQEVTVTGLLDWDRALWGDPEIEFAVLDYCGLSGEAFWEGYGAERDRSPEARVRQIFYLLYEIQKYIVIYHGRNGDPQGARQKKEQVMGIVREQLSR